MPELPQHPDSSEPRGAKPRILPLTIIGAVVGILAVAAFIALHLTGVLGPGAH